MDFWTMTTSMYYLLQIIGHFYLVAVYFMIDAKRLLVV